MLGSSREQRAPTDRGGDCDDLLELHLHLQLPLHLVREPPGGVRALDVVLLSTPVRCLNELWP